MTAWEVKIIWYGEVFQNPISAIDHNMQMDLIPITDQVRGLYCM